VHKTETADSPLPELPSFKASFGSLDWQIPIVLDVVGRQVIRTMSPVHRELFGEFVACLQAHGRHVEHWSYDKADYVGETFTGKKASPKFLEVQVYSLALPAAANLDLISKQGDMIMLTFFGSLLRDELAKTGSKTLSSSPRAKEILRKIVLESDKKWGVIQCVKQLGKANDTKGLLKCLHEKGTEISVSVSQARRNVLRSVTYELEQRATGRGVEEMVRFAPQTGEAVNSKLRERIVTARESNLRQLLNLYSSLDILVVSGKTVSMNREQLDSSKGEPSEWRSDREISKEEFFNSLCSSCTRNSKHQGDMVAIPIIRYEVCRELGIPWESFDRKFLELGYEFQGYRIGLSRGIFSKKWGINVGTANYYYVSLIKGDLYA
jgi:hypothetical protein